MKRNAVWEAHDKKIKPYVLRHKIISWVDRIVQVGLAWWLVMMGGANSIWSKVASTAGVGVLGWLMFFAELGLLMLVLGIPTDFASYWVEKRFGLSKQSIASWLVDKLKGLLLGAVLGLLVIVGLFMCVEWGRDLWWLFSAGGLLLFSILLAQLAPILLIPIFFKLEPMEEGPLKKQLLKLCDDHKIQVKDVFHLGLGEKTEKGNAAFVGLGKTKRIMIGDTLYKKFAADEVEAVFAHELGHQINNDLWKGIGLSSILMLVTFGFANAIVVHLGRPVFYPGDFVTFMIVLSLVQMFTGRIQVLFSRWRERMADAFAVKLGKSARLADALEKLTEQNWGLYYPGKITEFWSHSHPAPWRRIEFLRQ